MSIVADQHAVAAAMAIGSISAPENITPHAPVLADAVAAPVTRRQSSADAAGEGAYPGPADQPTQYGPNGLRFDFNEGCRVLLPGGEHPWRVRLSDLDTGNVLYDTEIRAGRVNSAKRYFVRFRLEAWQRGERLLAHDYCARNQEVLIRFPVNTLGDILAWLPYAVKFEERHGCRLTCAMREKLIPLFRDAYPHITFRAEDEVVPERFYATYEVAVFFQNGAMIHEDNRVPCDFRHVGLHCAAGYILGVDPAEVSPRVALADASRPIDEPYVCISVQSTGQRKHWNNPTGWSEIVQFLKAAGYRVICIDKTPIQSHDLIWNYMPHGVEDETGDRPLQERARWLKHAEFFVGLSSGLSWLAWAMGTPVVLISGFTHPLTEFATPYRVINYHVCNSCWNDPQANASRDDPLACPRHKGTARQFECTRLITAQQVRSVIRTIPGFGHPPLRR